MLGGAELPEGPIVVLDEEGHRKGSGVAELLAGGGRAVTLVGEGVAPAGQLAYSLAAAPTLRRLREAGVRVVAGARILEVERGRVVVEAGGVTEELEVAAVVHAGRHRPGRRARRRAAQRGIERGRRRRRSRARLVEDAVRSGWEAARAL